MPWGIGSCYLLFKFPERIHIGYLIRTIFPIFRGIAASLNCGVADVERIQEPRLVRQ
jgi:hypothetical protein